MTQDRRATLVIDLDSAGRVEFYPRGDRVHLERHLPMLGLLLALDVGFRQQACGTWRPADAPADLRQHMIDLGEEDPE